MRLALLLLAACGHVARVGYGPVVRDDGRIGAQLGVELGTHLFGTPETSMPIGVRVQGGLVAGEATALVAMTSSCDLGPGFWKARAAHEHGTGLAARWGGAIGGGYDRGSGGMARFHAALGYGSIDPATTDMRVDHTGVELAWQPRFDNHGIARWSASAEWYWQVSHVPESTFHGLDWFDIKK